MSNKINRAKPPAGALIDAVKAKDEARVRSLLDEGADVDERNGANMTPLHWAVRHDLTAISDLLLSRGADIEAKDEDGTTPLHIAAFNAYVAPLALLLRRGASVNARDDNGDTPLHFAAINGRTTLAELEGAEENLVRAIKLEGAAVAELLIDAGAALDATNSDGQTPLYYAASFSHLETSALLIAYNPENAPLDAATLEALRTNFDPAALRSAVTLALAARRDDIRRRRLNVLAAYYENRGGRRTSRRPTSRKQKQKRKVTRHRLTKRRRV
jgi:ankyrin repeat protein